MNSDAMRTITAARALGGPRFIIEWSDGTVAELALPGCAGAAGIAVGDWGHSLVLSDGAEIGADSLWLDTLAATGHEDAREFLMWRLANGLSLSAAAEALGLSRRTIAYYSNGERRVPKAILLACKGWDATHGKRRAA